MSNFSLDVRTGTDGSVIVQPSGDLAAECAVQFRQVLVHAVRKLRPLRLIVNLGRITTIDPINLGTLAALCGLADDHRVVVFLHNAPTAIADDLRSAGVPPQRFATSKLPVVVAAS